MKAEKAHDFNREKCQHIGLSVATMGFGCRFVRIADNKKDDIQKGDDILKILRQKHGFTLVELICVLVILAILAAMLVPSLTGYIDKAKQQSYISEAKGIWTAAQAAASEYYGLQNTQELMDNSLTTSCIIDGVQYTNLGRVSNSALRDEQTNWHKKCTRGSQLIAQQILVYLESSDESNARYSFGNISTPSSGTALSDVFKMYFPYKRPNNAVFIQVFYDKSCKILALNFGKDGYLVTMTVNGTVKCEKNGKIL